MGNFLSNEDEELSNVEELKVEKKRKRQKTKTIKRKPDFVEEDYDPPSNYNPFSSISFNRNDYEKDEEDLDEVPKPIYQKKKRKQSRKNVTFE
jgi:hypothetical protein